MTETLIIKTIRISTQKTLPIHIKVEGTMTTIIISQVERLLSAGDREAADALMAKERKMNHHQVMRLNSVPIEDFSIE